MKKNSKLIVILCLNLSLLMYGYYKSNQTLQEMKEKIAFSQQNKRLSEHIEKYGYAEVLESIRPYDQMIVNKIELISDSKDIVAAEVEYVGPLNVLMLYLLEISQQENFLKINEIQIDNSEQNIIKCLAKIDFAKNR